MKKVLGFLVLWSSISSAHGQVVTCQVNRAENACVVENERAKEICRHKVCPVPLTKEESFDSFAARKGGYVDKVVIVDGVTAQLFLRADND